MTTDEFRALALLLPDAKAGAHNGHPDFRLAGAIFATLWVDEERAVLKLSPDQQALLAEVQPTIFGPVAGAWGRRGWTNVDLQEADESTIWSALALAWRNVAPRGLATLYEALDPSSDLDERAG